MQSCLGGKEGASKVLTNQDQPPQFCQTRSQELFFPYLFTSWDTQKPQREIGQGNGSQKKISKVLVKKQTRAFILENSEFGGKGTTCANSHCISKCGIHSLRGNQVKKGRTSEEEPLSLDPTDSRKSCSSDMPL